MTDQNTKTILCIEDEQEMIDLIRLILSRRGFEILGANGGKEGLETIRREHPDLVLLDLMMPEMDGWEVYQQMKADSATRDIPVIVLTGKILTENDMVRLNRVVARVLEKGLFSVQETLNHIDTVLARKRNLGSDAQRLVRQAMAYLHERYTQPVSRQDLARYLGMSGDYLTFCFRKEVGMTPIAYLNRYRINQAKVLLSESEKNITEIAMSVGFSDSSYFSRVFRRQVQLRRRRWAGTGGISLWRKTIRRPVHTTRIPWSCKWS